MKMKKIIFNNLHDEIDFLKNRINVLESLTDVQRNKILDLSMDNHILKGIIKGGNLMFRNCRMYFENKEGKCITDCDKYNCQKNKLFLFKEGTEVFLWTDKFQLDGIHNHDTKEGLIENFGEDINYNKCFKNSVKGIIKKVGKNNMFTIESFTGEVFIYCNDYDEMWKVMK
jgi:hypothetical protein